MISQEELQGRIESIEHAINASHNYTSELMDIGFVSGSATAIGKSIQFRLELEDKLKELMAEYTKNEQE